MPLTPTHQWNVAPAITPESYYAKEHPLVALALAALTERGGAGGGPPFSARPPSRGLLEIPRLLDLERAVTAIMAALDAGQTICVHGDYDCDGLTSTALLGTALEAAGADLVYSIPDREAEGYGLLPARVERLAGEGVSLIVTVDCGSGAHDALFCAAALGVGVVVTDHHLIPDAPLAAAVINPQREGQDVFTGYSGCGVAYILVCALYQAGARVPHPTTLLDLVALGTVADMMPMRGPNRALVGYGLRRLEAHPRPGLDALLRVAGCPTRLRASHLSHTLAPRINASSRMGRSDLGLALLRETDPSAAFALAKSIEEANSERKEATTGLLKEARAQAREQSDAPCLVLYHPDWNPSMAGLAAGSLAQETGKSVVVLAGAPGARGSARASGSADIHAALSSCSDLFTTWGGHHAAAGLSLPATRIPELRAQLHAYAWPETARVLHVAGDASLLSVSVEDAHALLVLEPHGKEWEQPLFRFGRVRVESAKAVGSDKATLKMAVSKGGVEADCVGFGLGHHAATLSGRTVDLVAALETNIWRGVETAQLVIKDMAEAS